MMSRMETSVTSRYRQLWELFHRLDDSLFAQACRVLLALLLGWGALMLADDPNEPDRWVRGGLGFLGAAFLLASFFQHRARRKAQKP